MPLFSCLDHFLDVRAEILQIFRVKFWKILEAKKSFWNYLTFIIWSQINVRNYRTKQTWTSFWWKTLSQHQSTHLWDPESPFQTSLHKIFKTVFFKVHKSCFTMFTFRGTFLDLVANTTTASNYIKLGIWINWNPIFQTKINLVNTAS